MKASKKQLPCDAPVPGAHDRVKNYIIKENSAVEPLIDLGILTKDGKIVNAKYDKFKQINRFLEILNDTLVFFPDKKITILDFGCGKSHLSFIVYYFLKEMLKFDVQIIGLDLKSDVILKCNQAAEKYGYTSLRFETGNIGDFVPPWDIGMVISLHACDTATDSVLFKAVEYNAKVILSVPCCQHEFNKQIRSNEYAILTRYGVVQERIAALFTDSIRANLLEVMGYKTQLLEFIDFDNTPKNILIRAIKAAIPAEAKTKALAEVHALMRQFNLSPALYNLLKPTDIHQRLAALGTAVPEILLPGPGTDPAKWAVIACDQYTQDRAYWEQAAGAVGAAPSTLNLILPEIFLEEPGRQERINRIHRTMGDYLAEGVFGPPLRGCVYLERSTPHQPRRRGLIMALDLERYQWQQNARPLCRATEGTVPGRLPSRMDIRRDAPLETPHIIILIDDDEDRLLPALEARAKRATPHYQTGLMAGSGAISGWVLDTPEDWTCIAGGLEALEDRSRSRYGETAGTGPFLFAVGDGNHSLAAAKGVWEEYKAAHPGDMDHPARWALVEIENLYDPGIGFEPIHRVLFGIRVEETLEALRVLPEFSHRYIDDRAELSRLVGEGTALGQTRIGLITRGKILLAEYGAAGIATADLQPLLDRLTEDRPAASIDYIHGEDELFRIVAGSSALGILLPPVQKRGLFGTVARSGPLPRKSFSMGAAGEKRFYYECRRLFQG
ncbi:MAG: DUF1015 family protein [Treponema sp.]|nr:DUF1015 family protein [Treponema sp.]